MCAKHQEQQQAARSRAKCKTQMCTSSLLLYCTIPIEAVTSCLHVCWPVLSHGPLLHPCSERQGRSHPQVSSDASSFEAVSVFPLRYDSLREVQIPEWSAVVKSQRRSRMGFPGLGCRERELASRGVECQWGVLEMGGGNGLTVVRMHRGRQFVPFTWQKWEYLCITFM